MEKFVEGLGRILGEVYMLAGKSTEICRAAKAAHVKPNGRSVEEEVGVKERIANFCKL